jgi:hypothetical protein
MDKARLFRRGVHCLIALAPMYYLLPDDLPLIGLRRWVLLIAFFFGIAAFEAFRLRKGIVVMGLRPHEKTSIASFVWAAAGITAALWLLPRDIASAALVGMAFADPLAGELRGARRQTVLPGLVYIGLAVAALLVFEHRTSGMVVALSVLGAVSAVLSERVRIPHVDDDFVMIVVPGALMTILVGL